MKDKTILSLKFIVTVLRLLKDNLIVLWSMFKDDVAKEYEVFKNRLEGLGVK